MHEIRADKQDSNGASKVSPNKVSRKSILGAALVVALGANLVAALSSENSANPFAKPIANTVATYTPTFTPAFAPSTTFAPSATFAPSTTEASPTTPQVTATNTTPATAPATALGSLVSSSEDLSNVQAASESAVHHIRTTTNYEDGYQEVRHGTGFVVGQKFFTVFHNIDVLKNHGAWEREIDLGGMLVEPRIVDRRNDIAIFDLPTVLCKSWCNDRDPAARQVGLEQEQAIGWYEFVSPDDERRWRQARIKEVMFKNYHASTADAACQSDVVIAVDQPFYPGSSGGPVWDLASHRLLGMVQGSFVRESGEQVGYYKPFSCVQSLMTGTIGPTSVDLASKW